MDFVIFFRFWPGIKMDLFLEGPLSVVGVVNIILFKSRELKLQIFSNFFMIQPSSNTIKVPYTICKGYFTERLNLLAVCIKMLN